MRIGIFGGTFDPPHHGHLILARAAAEAAGLERVLLIPAARNPLKARQPVADGAARMRMLRAAIEGDELFVADDRELRRPPPSFTADTLEEIAREYPGAEPHLILGADNRPHIHNWHRAEDLRRMARFVWLARPGAPEPLPEAGRGEIVVRLRIEISSTDIRNRVASGRSIRYLVPDSVLQIIDALRLYQTAPAGT